MKKYSLLSQRFYYFFRYSRTIAIIGLVLFLGVTAFNTGNQLLYTVSYVLMLLTLACAIESVILYCLYFVLKNK